MGIFNRVSFPRRPKPHTQRWKVIGIAINTNPDTPPRDCCQPRPLTRNAEAICHSVRGPVCDVVIRSPGSVLGKNGVEIYRQSVAGVRGTFTPLSRRKGTRFMIHLQIKLIPFSMFGRMDFTGGIVNDVPPGPPGTFIYPTIDTQVGPRLPGRGEARFHTAVPRVP
jgi:hypothetical protein